MLEDGCKVSVGVNNLAESGRTRQNLMDIIPLEPMAAKHQKHKQQHLFSYPNLQAL